MSAPPVTVIVPVYNELPTLDPLLTRLSEVSTGWEVIIVDDGSTDGSAAAVDRWAGRAGWRVLHHLENRGKGSAVRTGLAEATGRVTIIQDADLEYEPGDIVRVTAPILAGLVPVCFGSRYLHGPKRPFSRFRVAVSILNGISRFLYHQHLTDQATCYKAMSTELWRSLALTSERFELCAEITAKLGRRRIPIHEVPIRYRPRTRAEGKKIGPRDGLAAVSTLIRVRMRSEQRPGDRHALMIRSAA